MFTIMDIYAIKRLFFIVFLLAVLVLPFDVFAYLDPGTGSYIIQLLIASAAGGIFAVKVFWIKIRATLAKIFGKKDSKKDVDSQLPRS